jgi:hypothetical protein
MKELENFAVVEGDGGIDVTISQTGQKISLPGLVVENGFDVPALGTLWLTSNDSPYEETLYISLVDSQASVTEQIELYQPYTPGVLKDVVVSNSSIQFEFWEGVIHHVKVDQEKRMRFTRLLPQAGCHYSSKFSPSYLTISQ